MVLVLSMILFFLGAMFFVINILFITSARLKKITFWLGVITYALSAGLGLLPN